MRPAQTDRVFLRFTLQESVDEPGRKAIPAAYPVVDVKLSGRRLVGLSIDPGHRAPTMAICGVNFAKGRRHDLDLRVLLADFVHHPEKSTRIQLRFGCDFRSRYAESHLQV